MSLFCSDRNKPRNDDECLLTLTNQDGLTPDQIDRLRMIERLGSVEQAKRVTFLHVCAMQGAFDDDR